MALAVHRAAARWRNLLVVLCISPLLISAVVRTYGWLVILGDRGVLPSLLRGVGIAPPRMMFNETGVVIGLVEILMPYMVLALLAGFGRLDPVLEDAAASLGATPWRRFWRVVVPLTLPGVLLGCLLAFVLAVSSFHHAEAAGGRAGEPVGDGDLRPGDRHAELAGGGGVVGDRAGGVRGGVAGLWARVAGGGLMRWVRLAGVVALFVFLLAPVLLVIPLSFSGANNLVWPPPSWSLRWYGAMLREAGLMQAAWNSLLLGGAVASVCLVFGIPGALALERGRFWGREAVMALITAPLLLPTIVVGLALLTVFVGLGLLGSWLGLVLAHLTITLPYAVRVLSTSLSTMPAGVEDAARSLGAGAGAGVLAGDGAVAVAGDRGRRRRSPSWSVSTRW